MLIELDISMNVALTVLRREACSWKHRRVFVDRTKFQDEKIGRCLCEKEKRQKRGQVSYNTFRAVDATEKGSIRGKQRRVNRCAQGKHDNLLRRDFTKCCPLWCCCSRATRQSGPGHAVDSTLVKSINQVLAWTTSC